MKPSGYYWRTVHAICQSCKVKCLGPCPAMEAAPYITWACLCGGWSPTFYHEALMATVLLPHLSGSCPVYILVKLAVAGDGLQHLTMKLWLENSFDGYWCHCHTHKLPRISIELAIAGDGAKNFTVFLWILIELTIARYVSQNLTVQPCTSIELSILGMVLNISPCSPAYWLSSPLHYCYHKSHKF